MSHDPRQAEAAIRVLDRDGRPCAHRRVEFHQQSHAFLFGCGAFEAIPWANDKRGDPFQEERMRLWLELVNYGTLPFDWGRDEPEEGRPNFEPTMNAARALKARGVTLKGHPLCWHTACADWLMRYDDKTILDKQLERIHRDVSAYAGIIDIWDVINETVIMPVFDRYDNAVTRICRRYGRETLIKEVFAAAKAANPDALLLINDFNLSDQYANVVRRCLDAGVPIGAVGLQTHQHQGYMGEAKLKDILRRFENIGVPLHFTENTLVSGHLMPPEIVDLNDYQIPDWPTTPEGEERPAGQMEEMYRLLFAHPRVEAITGWDFADGGWLGAPSGVITKENRTKPAYHALRELIQREWRTDCQGETDGEGRVLLCGCKGEYRACVDGWEGRFRLERDGAMDVTLAPRAGHETEDGLPRGGRA